MHSKSAPASMERGFKKNDIYGGTNADIYEDEDFLELLDHFNCWWKVYPLNVYGIVLELAQEELI